MPKNWASAAPEPAWWAELFSEDAVRARRERGIAKPFLSKVEYPTKAYAGRYLQGLVLERLKAEEIWSDSAMADQHAQIAMRDQFVRNAQESSLEELLEHLPERQHEEARAIWWGYVRAAGDGIDRYREWAESDFPRM